LARHAAHPVSLWLQLEAIKMLHQGDALWTALQSPPPASAAASNSSTALAQQRLRAAHMDLLIAEQRARHAIRGFWDDTLRAMEQVMGPSHDT
jgi:hypothetical protein